MRFSVDVNVVKQPEAYDKYYTAFINRRPLDTGSKVVEMSYYMKYGESKDVYCTFKIRS